MLSEQCCDNFLIAFHSRWCAEIMNVETFWMKPRNTTFALTCEVRCRVKEQDLEQVSHGDDILTWTYLLHLWPLVHRSAVDSLHDGQVMHS